MNRGRFPRNRFSTMMAVLIVSCGPPAEVEPRAQDATSPSTILVEHEAQGVLEREMERIDAEASRIDSIFQPLPLLRPAQEQALRRFNNAQHLARARALGVERALPPERLEELRRDGTLVLLANTKYWVMRDLDYSQPLAVPSVHTLLTEIGQRFHSRLAQLGAPAFRLEVTSVLRTAEDQAALRRINPNAALGETTHEYGTTIDVLYSAFSAPARTLVDIDTDGAEWLGPYLDRYAVVAAERVAARRALELKAILGEVLIEVQNEGMAMVTVERLQPVFHMTASRRL